jgi:hypothetical protein
MIRRFVVLDVTYCPFGESFKKLWKGSSSLHFLWLASFLVPNFDWPDNDSTGSRAEGSAEEDDEDDDICLNKSPLLGVWSIFALLQLSKSCRSQHHLIHISRYIHSDRPSLQYYLLFDYNNSWK